MKKYTMILIINDKLNIEYILNIPLKKKRMKQIIGGDVFYFLLHFE